jgi:hypothetical protein
MLTNARHHHRRPRMRFLAPVAALALLAAADADATVYKCQGEQGIVVYQEAPCLIGRELRNFDTDPPSLSIVPGGPAPAPAATAKPARDPRTIQGDVAVGKAAGDGSARRFIRAGMTESEVLAKIGRPDATAGGSKNRQTRWSYLPAADDPDTVTTITFANGVVSDVSRKVIHK